MSSTEDNSMVSKSIAPGSLVEIASSFSALILLVKIIIGQN